jgi:hypothetical protein
MRLIIKPAKDSFELILEAEAYRQAWQQNSRKLLAAFRLITGLDFKQSVITAYVYDGDRSFSGSFRQPMRLEARGASHDEKLLTLVHELSHRLLGGNGLALSTELNLSMLDEHKRIFLFEYDVVKQALGDDKATLLQKIEDRANDKDYSQAWQWAMSLSYKDRQAQLKRLIKVGLGFRSRLR